MKISILLVIDAIINLILGALLLLVILYPYQLTNFFGVPAIRDAFYPSIMGGILIGIALALFLEAFTKNPRRLVGLGLGGAICINLCGCLVLMGWLIFGDLDIPVRGQIFLWAIALILLIISGIELIHHIRSNNKKNV